MKDVIGEIVGAGLEVLDFLVVALLIAVITIVALVLYIIFV